MTFGLCKYCERERELNIYAYGHQFCSFDCEKLFEYRPNMDDDSFEYDKTVDEINMGDTSLFMKTCDGGYEIYSGYKVIITEEGMFSHKQLGGFRTIEDARKSWGRLKKKINTKSWADLQPKTVVGEVGAVGDKL